MVSTANSYTTIHLHPTQEEEILNHCRRKLSGSFLEDEGKELKAYGLIAGIVDNGLVTITSSVPLKKNARFSEQFKNIMDKTMGDYATPSITPLKRRGWVADPRELIDAVKSFHKKGWKLLGTYHMHRVGWEHDPVRDTPTQLDTQLARGSDHIMFIISMVNPEQPIIRAFYEGIRLREIPILSSW